MKHLLLLFVLSSLWGTGTLDAQCVAIDKDKLSQPMAGRVLFLWGQKSKFWPQNTTLRVRFLDGPKSDRDRAWSRFEKVDELVNLAFVRVPAGASDIRVSFARQGHWSYLGRDCSDIPQNEPTMNISLSRWDGVSEWDRVALHEILHAIGFGHEQAHPSAEIPWNRPVVYADYARSQGWTRLQVDRQVLNRYTGTEFLGSAYDKNSIMQYPIEARHVLDPRWAVGMNRRFSLQDIATLTRIYPPLKPRA
jgi:hypothetical protein